MTLLNFCNIGPETLDFTVDKAASKQGKMLPGIRLPILSPDELVAADSDYILILPWNLADEIIDQVRKAFDYRGSFIVPIPMPRVLDGPIKAAAAA